MKFTCSELLPNLPNYTCSLRGRRLPLGLRAVLGGVPAAAERVGSRHARPRASARGSGPARRLSRRPLVAGLVLVARGYCLIVIDKCRAADPSRHRTEDPSAGSSANLLSSWACDTQHRRCRWCRLARAIRRPAPLPAPNGSLIRLGRASDVGIAQSRSDERPLEPFLQTDPKACAASPVAAARVRRAKARRPGFAGFALAPAAGMRPLTGVSPNRKGEQEAHHKEPIMAELRNVGPLTLKPNPHNPRTHPAAGSYGRAAARLDQGDRHHSTAHCRREGRRARHQGRDTPRNALRSQPASRPST